MEKQAFETKLRSAEMEKAELSAVEQCMRENLDKMQHDNVELEREMTERLEQEKKDAHREIEDLQNKLINQENSSKEHERQAFSKSSEHEKELLLLEQKSTF